MPDIPIQSVAMTKQMMMRYAWKNVNLRVSARDPSTNKTKKNGQFRTLFDVSGKCAQRNHGRKNFMEKTLQNSKRPTEGAKNEKKKVSV
jgi:hypothetical protein